MIKPQIIAATLVAFGVVISPKYPSLAQTGTTTTPQTQPSTAPTTSSLSAQDKMFMIQAAEGGMAELQFAQLALQKSSNDSVKDYAQRMIDDHTKANDKLMAIAEQKGVTLPTTIGPKNEAVKAKLSKLSGTNFDKMYLSQAGVSSHNQQAALFKSEVQRGKDPDVQAFAAQTLPTVQEHLQMARSMAMGKKTSMNKMPARQ